MRSSRVGLVGVCVCGPTTLLTVVFDVIPLHSDLELYAKITKQDLSGPVPEDPMDKINQMRAEQAAEELANGGPLPAKVKKRSASAVELRGGGEEEGADDVQSALERVDEEMGDGGEDEEEDEDAEARLAEEEARQAEVDAEIAAAEAAEAAA